MTKIAFKWFYIVAITISLVASIQDKWQLAIWLNLLLILIELDQIHDTLKEKSAPQGSDK
jgi:hypothetical protein